MDGGIPAAGLFLFPNPAEGLRPDLAGHECPWCITERVEAGCRASAHCFDLQYFGSDCV
jgi:hypothetical protein